MERGIGRVRCWEEGAGCRLMESRLPISPAVAAAEAEYTEQEGETRVKPAKMEPMSEIEGRHILAARQHRHRLDVKSTRPCRHPFLTTPSLQCSYTPFSQY